MEDGLVPFSPRIGEDAQTSLNPCCNGRWSRTGEFDAFVTPNES